MTTVAVERSLLITASGSAAVCGLLFAYVVWKSQERWRRHILPPFYCEIAAKESCVSLVGRTAPHKVNRLKFNVFSSKRRKLTVDGFMTLQLIQ